MKISITPSQVLGEITAPASKSMMIRAVAASFLSKSKTIINNTIDSDDIETAISIIRSLGAEVKKDTEYITINSTEHIFNAHIDCGESALCLRIFAPLMSLYNEKVTFTGNKSLQNRYIGDFSVLCNNIDINFLDKNGYIPFALKGRLKAGKFNYDDTDSSQVLSGLLMTLPLLGGDSEITVQNLVSKPYVDLTIKILEDFGIKIQNQGYQKFIVKGNQEYISQKKYTIEGDWSGASFWLVAAAIAGTITVKRLDMKSKQVDKKFLEALTKCGAALEISETSIKVSKSRLSGFDFDATDCPDLFPPLVALAINCEEESRITGVNRLIHKESNRKQALLSEFIKLGAKISIENNTMLIKGSKLQGGAVFSHNDHRIAMALAVAALTAENKIEINSAECVSKSYRGFFEGFSLIRR